jgi:thioredoxin-disulfide reductase
MYDLIIIGSGPAGMAAGIYASRREMKTLIVGKEVGGQMVWASEIENYPGFKNISSFELIEKMREQTVSFGVEMKSGEVKKVEKIDGGFRIHTAKESYEGKTVIAAIGLSPRRLAVPGELELGGKGVSYCSNCDGPFFKNRPVAVVGSGNSALDAAEVLSKICNQVYLVSNKSEFKAFNVLVDEVKERSNVEIIMNADTVSIDGQEKVESITLRDKDSQEERKISVEGVFIEIGRIASTDLLAEFIERNERGQLIADKRGETKTEGMFAAGDVTDCEFKQISIAVGQGTIAALSAYQYLQMKKGASTVIDNSR